MTMGTSETCSTNQWDTAHFHWAVICEVRSRRATDMHNIESVRTASREVMLNMLAMLIPAGNA
jgi:hypothetical protein